MTQTLTPNFVTEPVGSAAPRLTGSSKINLVNEAKDEPISMSCPAQASPLPAFRLGRRLEPTFSLPLYLEPVTGTVPKFDSDTKLSLFERSSHAQLALLCPAQGFPLPSFRYKPSMLYDSNETETNRIPRKAHSQNTHKLFSSDDEKQTFSSTACSRPSFIARERRVGSMFMFMYYLVSIDTAESWQSWSLITKSIQAGPNIDPATPRVEEGRCCRKKVANTQQLGVKFSEPIGGSKPKLPEAYKHELRGDFGTLLSIACPAQAHPTPVFRLISCFVLRCCVCLMTFVTG